MNQTLKIVLILVCFLGLLTIAIIGLGDSLIPLLASFVLAYLIFPIIKKLEQKGLGRETAVIGVFVLFLAFLGIISALVIPGLISDAREFSKELPTITKAASHKIQAASARLGYEIDLSKEGVRDYIEAHLSQLSSSFVKTSSKWLKGVFTGFAKFFVSLLNIFLIPLFFFYIINDFEKITAEIRSFIPKHIRPRLAHYAKLCNTVLSGYIRGQLLVAIILGCLYAIGLSLVGIRFGFLIGLISGLISIVPYAGFTIGFATALTVSIATSSGMGSLIGVVVVYTAVQALEGSFITPKFVGDKVGLNSLVTILALIIGGNLMGMVGMLLAIPVAAILKSILRDLKKEFHELQEA